MGAPMLALYGLGSMVGAGIYGLVGRAAGLLGGAVWTSFVVAMAAALLTGLSYAALGARYPQAGGTAYVIERAFRTRLLSYTAGFCVVASGLTSMATGSRIVAANILGLFGLPAPSDSMLALVAVIYLALLCMLVWRGLKESLWFNVLCTFIEVSGLVFVIVMGVRFWGSADLLEFPTVQAWYETGALILQSSVLTFFAFIGFEDILNVSEEVRDPRRNVPIGLIAAMLCATALYLGVAITAVSVVPWQELAIASAPLGAVMERAAPWLPPVVYTVITIFAVANTALINYVMGSRLIFGMARQGLLPKLLASIHPTRNTPHYATVAIFMAATLLILAGDVSQLASATVILLLGVFILMNAAQVILTRRPGEPTAAIPLPIAVPIIAALICAVMLVSRASGDLRPLQIAGVVVVLIQVVYYATRKSHRTVA